MTLSMNLPDSEDVQLTEQNFRNVCRLCLRADEDFINVFDRIDQNPSKQPLAERIYDLYQIKVCILFLCFYRLEFGNNRRTVFFRHILAGQRRWITNQFMLSMPVQYGTIFGISR